MERFEFRMGGLSMLSVRASLRNAAHDVAPTPVEPEFRYLCDQDDPDGFPPSADLNGTWIGWYRQRRTHFGSPESGEQIEVPMVATLLAEGVKLTGKVTDVRSIEQKTPYFQIYWNSKHLLSKTELARAEYWLQVDPETHYASVLPVEAIVRGTISGNRVTFTKIYQGQFEMDWVSAGDRYVVVKDENYCVIYDGKISADGNVIQGRWRMPPNGAQSSGESGEFEFRRTEPDQ